MKKEGGLRTKGQFNKKSETGSPLISIITPVRNGDKYLEQTIQSVLAQTYDNIEYIIVDGASTDGTLDIIRKYESQIAYWVSEPDEGPNDAGNKGVNIASGDYALYLCADDYLYCDSSIENLLRLGLDQGTYPLLIAGRARFALNNELLNWVMPISESNMHKYGPHCEATLISSTIYKNIFNNTLFRATGDTHFWGTLRQRGLFQVRYVDIIVSVFRLGGITNNTKTEYYKCVEHEISRYMHYGDFSVIRLINSFARASIKKVLLRIMGESRYYRYILYNIYRFRRDFLR